MGLFKGEIVVTPQIIGVVSGNAAKTGHVGEIISTLVAVGAPVSLLTATPTAGLSLSLTPGDWNVSGCLNYTAAGVTTAAGASISAGLNSSVAIPTDGSEVLEYLGAITTGTYKASTQLPVKVFNVSTTTTVSAVASATFSAGTIGMYGELVARRVR